MSKTIQELQSWYQDHCDGDWEHQQGIKIETLDNPGWSVEIDLAGTEHSKVSFTPIREDRSDDDWVDCRVEKTKFLGRGGPGNLEEVLACFLSWLRRTS